MIKIYIVTFNSTVYLNSTVQEFIQTDQNILAYWNYLPFIYCIKSMLSAKELGNVLQQIFPQGGFLVAELNAENIDGRMQIDAWPWFYENQTRQPMSVASQGNLGRALLGPFGQQSPNGPGGLFELGKTLLGNTKKDR